MKMVTKVLLNSTCNHVADSSPLCFLSLMKNEQTEKINFSPSVVIESSL